MLYIIENKYSNVLFIIITFTCLFLDDIRLGFTDKNSDTAFDWIFLFWFFAFLVELIISCICKKEYLFSFFFWLDLAALLSIIFDIYFLLDAISVTFQMPTDATDVARAGRASRAGTKVGRLLKIVRMIRVFRVAKLYKQTKKAMDSRRQIFKNNRVVPEVQKDANLNNANNKQKKINDSRRKK